MRDIKGEWHVTGNVTLNDHSTLGQPLNQLSNEDLVFERAFRGERAAAERRPRLRWMAVAGALLALLLCTAGVIVMIQGQFSPAAILVALAAVLVGVCGLKFTASPWQFEQEHLDAMRQIKRILRSRGYRG
ncbi:DUF3040 domain-containing protein [Plantibacter sp. CFBP 8804]|uniref:DUF3040 domain-containing protein n=1 Tax=Plantibacter sp. CFBP 8804 TaxID=2775270 RepID=UPI00177B3730|nr:DUF3040 domain-containing protein [Plantibacter sp. CFBP 8804]MBD8518786.1 DUF3040 domain-containing protein [Plantibacter sp. CFBP 8804]